MTTAQLPHLLIENIYLQSLMLLLQDYIEDDLLSVHPHDSSAHLIRCISRQVAELSLVNRCSLRSCKSEYFSRELVEQLFPLIAFSPALKNQQPSQCLGGDLLHEPEPWSHRSRPSFINATISNRDRVAKSSHDFKFIWKALQSLCGKHLEVYRKHANVSFGQVPDAVVLWERVADESDRNCHWCMRFTCFGSVILLSSNVQHWILLEPAHLILLRREQDAVPQSSSGAEGCTAPQNTPVLSNIGNCKFQDLQNKYSNVASIKWKPPQRFYVFEDLVTLSSQMESLTVLDASGGKSTSDEFALTYAKCIMCREIYPECGKSTDKKMCGSCLYLMDLDVFKLSI